MRFLHTCFVLVVGALLLFAVPVRAQMDALPEAPGRNAFAVKVFAVSSSADAVARAESEAAPAEAAQDDRKFRGRVTQLPLYDWWKHPGVGVSVGLNGVGVDVAEAVRERVNVRVGAEFLRVSGQFVQQNAQVDFNLRLGGAHAGVDLFPFQRSSFRVSPQMRFGILTRGVANVFIPPGQAISFGDVDYTSVPQDPLRGNAYFDTRKFAPGITVGFGNLVPRTRDRHWTFPVDLGFYYIGQPNLQIAFTGTACSVDQSKPVICTVVSEDPDFQRDLKRFIDRNRHNVSYASLFPVLSFGVGYRF